LDIYLSDNSHFKKIEMGNWGLGIRNHNFEMGKLFLRPGDKVVFIEKGKPPVGISAERVGALARRVKQDARDVSKLDEKPDWTEEELRRRREYNAIIHAPPGAFRPAGSA
jgi:hypothetical protein